MFKRWIVIFLFICFLPGSLAETSEVISPKDTLYIEYSTNTNYHKTSWDTVYVKVSHGALVYWVPLSSDGLGSWSGAMWLPDSMPGGVPFGSWNKKFFAVYTGGVDTFIEDEGFGVRDTSELQGQAAGVTAPAIASEVADSLANRGYFRGLGAYRCTVTVQLADETPIPGIHVLMRSANQLKNLAHDYTDANGMCVFYYDTMLTGFTHKFWLLNVDYTFSLPESARIHNDTGLIFTGSPFDYGDPPPDSQCAVYDQVFNPLLDSLSGVVVSARVYVPGDSLLTYRGFPMSPFTVSDTTTVTGRFRLDLTPNAKFRPDSTKYIFWFEYPDDWGGLAPPFIFDTLTVPEDTAITYGELAGRR